MMDWIDGFLIAVIILTVSALIAYYYGDDYGESG
jgi:hypothetical protein